MRHLKRLAVVMLVMAMILSTAGIASAAYPDTAGRTCAEAVAYLRDLGVVAGFPDGTYKPDATLTRAQAAKIVVISKYGSDSLANLLKGAVAFTDVPGTHWASGFIALAKNAGIIIGYPDGTFQPEGLVTYAELAKMLVEAAGLSPIAGLTWPANYVGAAQAAGMLAGVPLFAANSPATRGDCAIMAAYTVKEVKNPATGKTLAQTVFGESIVASIEVTPANVSLSAGTTAAVVAVAKDAAGDVVSTVFTWSSSNTGVATVVNGLIGAVAPGTAVITVSAEGKSATVPVAIFGAATAIRVTPPTGMVANGKSAATVTGTVVDAYGNTVPTFSGTLTFASSNTAVVAIDGSTVVTAVNGVATAKVVAGSTVGSSVISATATGLVGGTATLTTVKQVLNSIGVSADPASMSAIASPQSKSVLTVTLRDQEGVALTTANTPSGFNLDLTTSDNTVATLQGSTTLNVSSFTSGVASVDLWATNKVGTVAITGAVKAAGYEHIAVPTLTVTTQIVGPAYRLAIDSIATRQAGQTQTVYVRVLDFNGNQLTNDNITSITLMRGTTSLGNATVANGKATFTSSIPTVTGTYTYEASSGSLVKATAQGVITPGTAAGLSLSAAPATLAADGYATTTLTAKVVDAYGNAVTDANYTVTFKKVSGDSVSFTTTTITTVGGVATTTAKSTGLTGDSLFTVEATGLATANVTVAAAVQGVPSKLGWGTYAETGKKAGENARWWVNVLDVASNHVTKNSGTPVTLTVYDGTTVVASYSATTTDGVAKFNVNLTKAGTTYSVEATATGLTKVTGGSVAFVANTGVALKLSSQFATMSVGGTGTLTAQLADVYGNTVSSGSVVLDPAKLNLSLSNSLLGTLSVAWTEVTAGFKYTKDFTASAIPGTATFTLTHDGLTSTSTSVATVIAGPPNSYNFKTIAEKKVSETGAWVYQTVTVEIRDYSGNPVTTDNSTKIKLSNNSSATASSWQYKDPSDDTWKAYTSGTDVTAKNGLYYFQLAQEKAQTVTYTAAPGTGSTLPTVTATGIFVPVDASKVVVLPSSPAFISGNGAAVVLVKAQVQDKYSNKVPTFAGTVQFSIQEGADYATLLQTSADLVNGEAAVQVQSKAVENDSPANLVKMRAKLDIDGDGKYTTTGEDHTLNETFKVLAPSKNTITSIVINGDTDGVVEALETITITFKNEIIPTTIHASLSKGTSVTGVLSTSTGGLIFTTATNTVTISNIATLTGGTVTVGGSATVDLALDATGKILTITVNTLTSTPTLTAIPTGATIVGGTPLRDVAGNPVVGPLPAPTGTNW